jgi:hypothetical protein
MPASKPGPSADVERLYGVPLDEFTSTRDALARELRQAGDRAAADALRRLRKPSVAAWALNQVRRHERGRVDQLLAAGERLRDAQRRLLAGGERGALRDAATEERRLVGELVEAGERELVDAGHAVNSTIQNRLRETLHSAAGDDEARELLGAGRLVRDHQISDLGLPGAMLEAPPRTAGNEAPPRTAADKAPARNPAREQAARRRLEKAQAQEHDAQARAKQAERAAQDARRAVAKASSSADRAEAAAQREREHARKAAARVTELQSELRDLVRDGG